MRTGCGKKGITNKKEIRVHKSKTTQIIQINETNRDSIIFLMALNVK